MTQVPSLPARASTTWAWGMLLFAALALTVIRFTGPPDLMENDQQAPASYVLDAVVNGHWIVQHDDAGNICSKPPLYTWIAAAGMKLSGQLNTFWLHLPNALAMTGVALLLLGFGKKIFSVQAGLFAALAFLFCHLGMKHVALARTDALLTLTVTWGALLAFNAWAGGGNWLWFWLACAAATLTKGPLGVLLAGAGLLAAWWEREPGGLRQSGKSHLLGLLIFVVLCGGWWWLAYQTEGNALTDKMLKQELVTHAVTAKADGKYWRDLFKPTGYFLGRFAPWFFLTLVELWRVLRRPSSDKTQRQFERFITCWLGLGWLAFSLSPHHRPDHILPLLPAAALLAGMAVARFTRAMANSMVRLIALSVAIAGLVAAFFYYGKFRPNPQILQQTRGMIQLAGRWRAVSGDNRQLTHMDSPYALQFYLGTMEQKVSPERAAKLLRSDTPAFIAVRDSTALVPLLAGTAVTEIARWPETGESFVRIITNSKRK